MQRTEYLVDLLADASIDAPGENYVDLENMILRRDVETGIFQHPPSKITFAPITIGSNATLSFACGIKQAAWPHIRNAVRFVIKVETSTGRKTIFETKLDPRRREEDRGWRRHSLDLSVFEGQALRVVLQTEVGWRRSTEYAWAGWANPRIDHDLAARALPRRHDRHPHVFLITADALSARYLAGYGHPKVQTPNLDRLAQKGVLFEQAWSQSCMTFGSYVSMLTGLQPNEHGVSREWQPFPVAKDSLPRVLARSGWHTLFAPSSLELSGRNNYLDQVFAEVVPTLSNPMQDGAVTTRQFIHRFDQRADQSQFSWIHYFDIHPPSMPPAPFNGLYYSDDPTDAAREYLPNEVPRIRSVESALIICATMPLLENGRPVAEVIDILEDTAAVLTGQSEHRPDLAEHVLNLGKRATRGLSANDFGEWLTAQAREMVGGEVPAGLVQWLKGMLRLLETTETDITSWLANVVDFRYPLDMYLSTVSYFDAQVGALTAYLQEQGLYDQSLIIVTAPHGEILQDKSLPYHHFLLTPDTLRVPLIMKLPQAAGHQRTGIRINGVFDLIDLFPTTMDILGLKNSSEVSGVSRWDQIKSGEPIPAHDSFAAGLHQFSQSVCRPPHLFVREKEKIGMPTFHAVVSGSREVLYDTASGEKCSSELPDVVGSLSGSWTAHVAGQESGKVDEP
jgi:arylsulfatase A-like enzyme